jgi:hypothetical protein
MSKHTAKAQKTFKTQHAKAKATGQRPAPNALSQAGGGKPGSKPQTKNVANTY